MSAQSISYLINRLGQREHHDLEMTLLSNIATVEFIQERLMPLSKSTEQPLASNPQIVLRQCMKRLDYRC